MNIDQEVILDFISQFIRSIAGFVSTLVIARLLGASGLGVYAIVIAVLFWLKIPVNSVKVSISKRVSEGESGTIAAGMLLNAGYLLLGVAAIVLVAPQIDEYVGQKVAFFMAILLISDSFFNTVEGVLIGLKRIALSGWLRTGEQLFRVGLQVALIIAGFGIRGLLAGHFIAMFVAGILGVYTIRHRISVPSSENFRSLTSYAKYSWLGTTKSSALDWADITILGFFVSSQLVGVYKASWTLAAVLVLAANSIERAIFPTVSELSVTDDLPRIHTVLNDGILFTGIFLIPGFFGAALLGEQILGIYSAEFTIGYGIFLILILARLMIAYGRQFGNIINAANRPDITLKLNAIYIGMNIVLNLVLVYLYGWVGAAVATAITGLTILLGGYLALSELIGKPSVPVQAIGYQVISSLAMVVVLLPLLDLAPGNLIGTLTLVTTGAVVYFLVLIALSEQIRERLLAVLR